MPADVSFVTYFAPIIAFLLVTLVVAALLNKTEILGKSAWLNVFIALAAASIFISVASAQRYVLTIIPWAIILVISLFFILVLLGLVGKEAEFMHKGLGIAFAVLLFIAFLVSGVIVFSSFITPYLPGSIDYGYGSDENIFRFVDWLFSSRVLGAILLLIVSAIASWVLVKTGDKKGQGIRRSSLMLMIFAYLLLA